ncbi:FUSC family protein [Arthrobacter sp. PAMC 25486]|uniref:FUSC family protein n=1 Tax=Arthrobacter sp. PAMC 25486 TaxID=1494608 RepID=UPI0020A683CA|nr:FUSC family protein [Arthrobacter sp. PAMC 25486]
MTASPLPAVTLASASLAATVAVSPRSSMLRPATLLPSGGDRRAARRMTLSFAVPILLLLAVGRPELIIYAAFGSFVGMYGRDEPHQLRLLHQGQAAALLIGGALLGIFCAVAALGPWALIGCEALLAGAASLVADRFGLKPTGPFFTIFAFGALASVPPIAAWWAPASVSIGAAAFSVLVGFSGWVGTRLWHPGAARAVVPPQAAAAAVHALRYVLAVVAAGSVGHLLGMGHPYWAMAAAAVPLAAESLNGRIRRGLHRMFGTFAGVAVTALILWPRPPVLILAVAVLALIYPTELFMQRHYGMALVFFTPLILIMTLLAVPGDPAELIRDRAAETVVGALAGMLVAVVVREPRRRTVSPR